MKAPRLLYVFPEPLPLRKARAVQVINTVKALAESGTMVDLAFVPVEGIDDPFLHYGMTCPANVRLVPLSRGLPWPFARLRMHSNRFFLLRLRAWFKRQSTKEEGMPRVAFARHVKLASMMLKAFPALPLIYEAHEVFSAPAPKLFSREASVLKNAAAVIAITQGLADALNRYFEMKRDFFIVPSATRLPEMPGKKVWSNARQEIIYAGSLFDWKGVDDLIVAARELPGCKITIIGGDGKGVSRLRDQVSPEGAQVEFVGHLPHEEVLNRLQRACIAVLPNRAGSVSDFTSPIKLFEYMAAGCAVVVSDLPVLHEVLEPDEAAWFMPGDSKSLAGAIGGLVDDPGRAQVMGARLAIKAREFTWQARAGRLRVIVEKVSRQKNNVMAVGHG